MPTTQGRPSNKAEEHDEAGIKGILDANITYDEVE